jgi:hypothetical protein
LQEAAGQRKVVTVRTPVALDAVQLGQDLLRFDERKHSVIT